MARRHPAATSAKRRAAPPNPSPPPPAADGSLPLLHAARRGDLRLFKRLVGDLDKGRGRHREVVDAAKEEGLGAGNGRLRVCRYLVEELGVDVDAVDDGGRTPLLVALPVIFLIMGQIQARLTTKGLPHFTMLLQQCNKKLPGGVDTPLLVAVTAPSLKCVKLLVEAGADVNGGLVAPLVVAAEMKGLTACLKLLLEAGADPNVPDPSGRFPIELAALNGTREGVEILFPVTSCIPTVHDWSVDGIIHHAKVSMKLGAHSNVRTIEQFKLLGVESLKRNDYFTAATLYSAAMEYDRHDATLLSDRSFCWLRMGDGHEALQDALACREMRPGWPKACYRQDEGLMLLKDYRAACDAFLDAVKLDPGSPEIEAALREAMNSLKTSSGAT